MYLPAEVVEEIPEDDYEEEEEEEDFALALSPLPKAPQVTIVSTDIPLIIISFGYNHPSRRWIADIGEE